MVITGNTRVFPLPPGAQPRVAAALNGAREGVADPRGNRTTGRLRLDFRQNFPGMFRNMPLLEFRWD